MKNTETRSKALLVAETAQDHKALNLRILSVTNHCSYADYFILMTATSTRHAQSLAQSLAREFGLPPSKVEGMLLGEWVLLDLGDVIVHVFYEPMRAYYSLDKIWARAQTVDMAALRPRAKRKTASARATNP